MKYEYAYIMENEYGYIKVGKANNPEKRRKYLNTWSKFGEKYTILEIFEFDNVEDAYEMEIWLHRYYKAIGGVLYGQDHFLNVEFHPYDMSILEEKAEEIRKKSKKWLDNYFLM